MMNEEQNMISQMRAVTISREYGSGGGEVAARLARRLGWQLVDHEVVVRVAQELGVSEAEAEARDEHTESLITRMLLNLSMVEPALLVGTSVSPLSSMADEHTYQEALRRVVTAAVATGHVVIVGRGSQVLLTDRRDVLHVRIVAPLELRIAYVMRREGLDHAAAQRRIQLKEHDRDRYLQEVHHQHPADPHLYDLVVNTGILDLDSAAEVIICALARKATRLATPVEELGPSAGLAPYPGRPSDLRPPEQISGAPQTRNEER
jgi:cytidylate kinase